MPNIVINPSSYLMVLANFGYINQFIQNLRQVYIFYFRVVDQIMLDIKMSPRTETRHALCMAVHDNRQGMPDWA